MSISIHEYLSDVSVGTPASYARLTLFPLRVYSSSTLDYLLVDEAAQTRQIIVEETQDGGSVPRVRVRSTSDRLVFVPDGTTLVGGKQDRTVNVSVLLAPKSETNVPVSCIERGRWSSETMELSPAEHSDFRMRAKMCLGVAGSLGETDDAYVEQGTMWDDVDSALGHCQAKSVTQDYHAGFGTWQQQISEYEANLPCPLNAEGVAVCLDGHEMAIDLFDGATTLRSLWARLCRSYAFGALRDQSKQMLIPTSQVSCDKSPARKSARSRQWASGLLGPCERMKPSAPRWCTKAICPFVAVCQ